MMRAGNEDALAVVHATELRDGVHEESAVVLAADGMGGSAAGEVAATLAVQTLRRHLLHDPSVLKLGGVPGGLATMADRAAIRQSLGDATQDANQRGLSSWPARAGRGAAAAWAARRRRSISTGGRSSWGTWATAGPTCCIAVGSCSLPATTRWSLGWSSWDG